MLSVSEDVLFCPQHKKYSADCHGVKSKETQTHSHEGNWKLENLTFFLTNYLTKQQSIIKIFAEIEKRTM